MRKTRKYERPPFLVRHVSQTEYEKWLSSKANTHIKRDQNRGNRQSTREQYKLAIHNAVVESEGLDAYTGKPLRWDLIRAYNNTDSEREGRKYKAKFSDLPTVDHVGDGIGHPDFRICSWKVNDAKNELSLDEFVALCEVVLEFNRKNRRGSPLHGTN